MPIPKRKAGEDKNDFILRCMNDPVMIKEYSKDQRYAICIEQLNESKKNNSAQ